MTSLKQLEERKDEIDLTLDRIEEILQTYEKKYDKRKELEMKKAKKLMEETKTIANMSTRVEKEITGPKTAEAGRTKEKIKKFEEQLKEEQTKLKKESFYYYETGVEGSFEKIVETKEKFAKLRETLKQFQYYEEMFKFPES